METMQCDSLPEIGWAQESKAVCRSMCLMRSNIGMLSVLVDCIFLWESNFCGFPSSGCGVWIVLFASLGPTLIHYFSLFYKNMVRHWRTLEKNFYHGPQKHLWRFDFSVNTVQSKMLAIHSSLWAHARTPYDHVRGDETILLNFDWYSFGQKFELSPSTFSELCGLDVWSIW